MAKEAEYKRGDSAKRRERALNILKRLMYVGSKRILKVPAFDLAWLDLDSADGKHHQPLALLPGGGGSTKSGVKNQIQLVSPDDAGLVYTCLEGFLTDTDDDRSGGSSGLCSGISTGTLSNGVQVICTLIDDRFLLLGVEKSNSEPSTIALSSSKMKEKSSYIFTRLAEVKADFSTEMPTVNCCCVVSIATVECLDTICRKVTHDYIVTGGQDGVVRLWKVSPENGDDGDDLRYSVTKVADLGKHDGAVMSLSFHDENDSQWAISASRDGMVKLWDITEKKELADVPYVSDGIIGSGSVGRTSAAQCRGAVFAKGVDAMNSTDGLPMYSIQSSTKGPAHLIRWKVLVKNGADPKTEVKVIVTPNKVLHVSKTPATRLAISGDGLFLAVGCADGTIHVFRTHTSLVRYTYFTCHDMPVTGLAFAPSHLATRAGAVALVASGSADNRFAIMPLGGYSVWFTTLARLLFLLIILFLSLAAAAILFKTGPFEQFIPRIDVS